MEKLLERVLDNEHSNGYMCGLIAGYAGAIGIFVLLPAWLKHNKRTEEVAEADDPS